MTLYECDREGSRPKRVVNSKNKQLRRIFTSRFIDMFPESSDHVHL